MRFAVNHLQSQPKLFLIVLLFFFVGVIFSDTDKLFVCFRVLNIKKYIVSITCRCDESCCEE